MSTEPPPTTPSFKAAAIVWWIVWFAILNSLMLLYFLLKRNITPGTSPMLPVSWLDFIGLAPLSISCVLRWLVIPRVTQRETGFIVFIVGIALAESCGILGLVIFNIYSKELVTLSLLGILQWAPLFARRFYEPAAENNAHGLRQP